jgi:hypothetical protein
VSVTRIIILTLALTHAAGLAELVRRATCEAECRDDGCKDDCGPGEAGCACHCPGAAQLVAVSTPQLAAKIDIPMVVAPAIRSVRTYASPDPRDILHVPRRLV